MCLTLGVLTVVVKGRGARSRCRTEFVAIFVLSCLHVHFRRYLRAFRGGALVGPRCFVAIYVLSGSSTSSMFIFRGNYRTFRCSAMLLKGSETGFAWKLSYFFGPSTSSMFIFRGNSRTFRCSGMLLNDVFTIKLVLF